MSVTLVCRISFQCSIIVSKHVIRQLEEVTLNWSVIIKYATAVYIAGFTLGFLEGLLFEPSFPVAFSFNVVSFMVCGAIFSYLGYRQAYKVFAHAWLMFFLQVPASLLLILLTYRWVGVPSIHDIIIEYILLICSLVVGTSIGKAFRENRLSKGVPK